MNLVEVVNGTRVALDREAVLSTAYVGGVEADASGDDLLKARPDLLKALNALGAGKASPVSISG